MNKLLFQDKCFDNKLLFPMLPLFAYTKACFETADYVSE